MTFYLIIYQRLMIINHSVQSVDENVMVHELVNKYLPQTYARNTHIGTAIFFP